MAARLRRYAPALVTAGAVAALIGALYNFILLPLTGRFTGPFEDFAAYSGAAHFLASGLSPYAGFDGGTIVMSGFDYPPFTAAVLRWLAALDAHWEQVVWLLISLSALLGGAVITARSLLPATWPRSRLAVLVALAFPPATYNLWHGQINTIIFLLLAVALHDYLAGHRVRCGLILGIAAGVKLAPIVLLLLLVRRGWWRGAIAGAAAAAGTVAFGVLALGWPVTHQYLTSVLPVLSRDNGWIYNQSWNGVVSRLAEHSVLGPDAGAAWVRPLVVLLIVATVAVLAASVRRGERTRAERGAEFAVGIVAMLLVGTITWYPIQVHVLIAVAAAVALARERGVHARALWWWSGAVIVGTGWVAGAAIAAFNIDGIAAISRGGMWWLFLQACSLPAVLAVGLGLALAMALRGRAALNRLPWPEPVSPAAAPAR